MQSIDLTKGQLRVLFDVLRASLHNPTGHRAVEGTRETDQLVDSGFIKEVRPDIPHLYNSPVYTITDGGIKLCKSETVAAIAICFPDQNPYILFDATELAHDVLAGELDIVFSDTLDMYAHEQEVATIKMWRITLWELARLPEWEPN